MESFNADEPVVRAVRTLQIMVGGMIFGAVFFLLVALVTFGKQGNTRLAADATAGAQTILTYDHVPVGTRVVIGAGTTSEELKVVGQTEKIEGVEQLKLRLDSALAADHTKDEAIRRYQPGRQPAIAYILLACTAGPLAGWAVVPTAMTRNARKKLVGTPEHDRSERQDTVALAMAFQTRTLVAAAQIETAVFLNVLAYLLAQVPLSAVVAVGLIVLLGFHFPTHGRAAHWMETQRTLMQPGL